MRVQTVFAVITLSLMYDPAYSNKNCSTEKRCLCLNLHDGSIKADCSNLNLTSVPQLFGNITVVDLSCNELLDFYNNGTIPNSILHLNLSNNTISRFTKDAFEDFPHLEELNLRHNNLSYEIDVFERGIFRNLKNLKILNLQHNIQKMVLEYPDAIAQIASLRVLKLDGIKSPKFNTSFKYLRNLQNLTLSGDSGYCYIRGLHSEVFLNIPFITFLDLSFCDIRYIENGTFNNLLDLRHLNISHNKHLTFNVLANLSHDLQFTAIDVLDFSKIHCTYGPGTYLYGDDVKNMKKTKLREVYLDSNRLVITDVASVLNLPTSLKKLSLGDNRLTMGAYIYFVQGLYNLETFVANDQYKSHVPTPDTNRFEICYDWRGPDRTVEDQSSYNDIFSLHRHNTQRNYGVGFVNFEYYSRWMNFPLESGLTDIPLPPNLSTARFESGFLKYPIPEMSFSRNNSISHVYLRDNILYSWEGPIYNLHQLLYIDLSQNFCSNLSSVFFTDCVTLQFLNISNNLLGFTFNVREDFHPFVNLTNLKTLDASINRIERLSKKVFSSLKNLNILDLHSNSLTHWNFTLKHMKKLRYIDLSGNHLTTIPKAIRDELSDLALNNSLSINLGGNSFRCDCSDNSQAFVNWMSNMQKRYQLFKKFNKYTCTAFDDTTIVFSSLDDYILRQKRECGFHLGLIVGALVAVVVSVVCIVGGIIYRYRWRLRYMFYVTKSRYLGYSVVRDCKSNESYQYDIFVSYAEEDSLFVRNDFLENIENCHHIKTCVHQRDFLAGLAVAENITNAINNSRKTVVILSPNYIKSNWCMFEFHMARMESIYSRDGSNIVFLLIYRPVPAKELSLELLHIMESHSYIEYPTNAEQRDEFWQNVVTAIKI